MPKFQKRHHEAVAKTLEAVKPRWYGFGDSRAHRGSTSQWTWTVDIFIATFKHDNPKFDVDEFLKAVGRK